MKKFKHLKLALVCYAVLLQQSACNQPSFDAELKADITAKAKADVNFAGVSFTVEHRKVTVWGKCPTQQSRQMVIRLLETIHMLEGIEDHLTIAPVILGSAFSLKQQTDSILSNYPSVAATVSDTIIILEGKIKNKDLQSLLPAMATLHRNVTTNRLKRDK